MTPKEALAAYGPPEIFNTDQGSQFTSGNWIDGLKEAEVQISMDDKGRWIDNRMIERQDLVRRRQRGSNRWRTRWQLRGQWSSGGR